MAPGNQFWFYLRGSNTYMHAKNQFEIQPQSSQA